MLRLKTRWGTYILSNALRIDVYSSKAINTWEVFIAIDSFKHLLLSFETERDSFVFCSHMRDAIHDMFLHDDNATWDIDDDIKSALYETEQQGLVE